MTNITLAVPKELKTKMDSFVEINWSAVARQAFDEKINEMEIIKKFKANSTLTEKDALKMGVELSRSLVKRRYSS